MHKLFSKYGLLTLLLLCLISSAVSASLTLVSTSVNHVKAPRGGQVDMLYFKVQAVGGIANLNSVSITNTSTDLRFFDGITAASLYKDVTNSGFSPTASSLIQTKTFTGVVGDTIFDGFSDSIPSGDVRGYFLVYTLSDTAALNVKANITLTDIKDGNNTSISLTGKTTVADVTSTGYSNVSVQAISPKVVVPGQTGVPLMHLSIKALGEDVNQMNIKITNESRNFVTAANNTNGVVAAYLYKDETVDHIFVHDFVIPPGDPNQFLVKKINPGEFTSSSEGTFTISLADSQNLHVRFPNGVSTNFFVVYDIGNTFPVSSDTKVNTQLTSLSGKGTESNLNLNFNQSLPVTSIRSLVAGLTFSELSKININSNFGAGTIAPIFKFKFKAFQASMNLTTLTIQNNGTVPFITDPTGVNGVTRISIYKDNGNGSFDGVNSSSDTLVGDLSLGTLNSITGLLNQSNRAVIPIRLPNTTPLKLFPFTSLSQGYPQDNSVIFFVVYYFGASLSNQVNASANILTSTAALENATAVSPVDNGSGVIITQNISLSGTLPSNASPLASLSLLNTNVVIKSINSFTDTNSSAIQGQIKIPMFFIQLNSRSDIPSASFIIRNESTTFSNINAGVSKVWLYKDDGDGQFDSGDTFISSNDHLSDTSTASLNGIHITQGLDDNKFIVLYDIGQVSALSSAVGSQNVRAQFNGISNSNITVGGELPNPKKASALSILPKKFSFSSASTSLTTFSGTFVSFNVVLFAQNASTQSYRVNEITPRFYLGSVAGQDVTFEYHIKGEDSLPVTLSANTIRPFRFTVKPISNASVGNVTIDGYTRYALDKTHEAVVSRYKGISQSFSAIPNAPHLTITSSAPAYPWSIQAYIESMQFGADLISGSVEPSPFSNFGAVPANSQFRLFFRNTGRSIDDTSLKLTLNGAEVLLGNNTSGSASFTYDKDTGAIFIPNLGTKDGTLKISAKDLEGSSLNDASIVFKISDKVQLYEPLFYPNPYHPNKNNLVLGFNLTQPATVHIYVYNFIGAEVARLDETVAQIGYHYLSVDNTRILRTTLNSGMYICKLVAQDSNGNTSIAMTRLAVF